MGNHQNISNPNVFCKVIETIVKVYRRRLKKSDKVIRFLDTEIIVKMNYNY